MRVRVPLRDFVFQACLILTLAVLAVAFSSHVYKQERAEGAGATQTEHAEQKKREPFWERAFDDPVAMFTLVLTAFTGILAVYTAVTGHATRRLVRGAEDTAERQLRAYVYIGGGSIVHRRDRNNNQFLEGNITFKNFGLTPANKFRTWCKIEIGAPGRTDFAVEVGLAESIVGPGAEAHARATTPPTITNRTLYDIALGHQTIYFWGQATYVDAFGAHRFFRFYDVQGQQMGRDAWSLSASRKPYESD